MEVYIDSKVRDASHLRDGTVGTLFRIEAAEAYAENNSLSLGLRESGRNRPMVSYELVGNVLHRFMDKMGARKVEDLRGRSVVGFVHRDEPVLQGLAAHK